MKNILSICYICNISICNNMFDINIRPAIESDAPIIARCVLAAMEILDIDAEVPSGMMASVKNLEVAASDEKRLYSVANTLVAEVGNEVVGCIISYDGSNYAALRKRTFDILYEESVLDLRGNPMETGPGEYYLDCMAIKRENRGKGIGLLLMKAAIERGKTFGIKHFALLVEKSHTRLSEYYQQLGFVPKDEFFAFGSKYVKMVYVF